MWVTLLLLLSYSHILWLMYMMVNALFRGFWLKKPGTIQGHPLISIVIPMRNERYNAERCVRAIFNQTYKNIHCIVVDDHSTDDTPSILRRMKQEYPTLNIVTTEGLTEGWTGKNSACWHGAQSAKGDFIFFIDADTTLQPRCIQEIVAYMQTASAGAISLIPHQVLGSLVEKITMPALYLCSATRMDFYKINSLDYPDTVANGQFIGCTLEVYKRIGGHFAFKGQIQDDFAFARLLKKHRISFRFVFAQDHCEARMYRSFREIMAGFGKNLWEIQGYDSWLKVCLGVISSLNLAVTPWLCVCYVDQHWSSKVFEDPLSQKEIVIALALVLTLLGASVGEAIYLKISPVYVIFMSWGFLVNAYLIFKSFWRKSRGVITWHGRAYRIVDGELRSADKISKEKH